MNKFYNGSFYLFSMKESFEKAGTWPYDGVDVDNETMANYAAVPPRGKVLGADKLGNPVWVDIPQLSTEQQITLAEQKKERLRVAADKEIAWRQYAVDKGIATTDEISKLEEWQLYMVFLMRVVTSKPEWPTPPGS